MKIVVISLLCILSGIKAAPSIRSVLLCTAASLQAPNNILLIVQTPIPIKNTWEAVFVFLESEHEVETVNSIVFVFTLSVQVEIENNGTRTQLESAPNDSRNSYKYENRGLPLNVMKIFVRNVDSYDTPHLTSLEYNPGYNSCWRIKLIQYELIPFHTILPQRNDFGYYTVKGDFRGYGRDLSDYIKDVYSTTIYTQYTRTAEGKLPTSSCGKRLRNHAELITNGYPTLAGDWPWHAAVFHSTRTVLEYKCGGSLITKNSILTAGHCVHEGGSLLIPKRIIIRLGLYNKLIANSNTQEFQVNQIIPHANFSADTLGNDIAIIQLATEAELNDYVQPVCLWLKDKGSIRDSEGKQGYVIGWGITEEQENVDLLSEARMPVVSHEDCLLRKAEFFKDFLSYFTFCAGFRNGTSVCNGDSGGGMFFQDDDGAFRIRGIVSVSIALQNNTCDPYEYIIFTNVGRYIDWIENTIAEHF